MADDKPDKTVKTKPGSLKDASDPAKASALLNGYSKGIQKVPAEYAFITNDCQRISSLLELAYALESMQSGVFSHHVSKDYNDFYNWVKNVIKDDELAKRVWKDETHSAMAATVAKRILEHAGISSSAPEKRIGVLTAYYSIEQLFSDSPGDFKFSENNLNTGEKDLIKELDTIILRCDVEEACKRHRMLQSLKSIFITRPSERIRGLIAKLGSLQAEDPEGYKLVDDLNYTLERVVLSEKNHLQSRLEEYKSRLEKLDAKLPEIFEAARMNPECCGHVFKDNEGNHTGRFENSRMYDDELYQALFSQFRKMMMQVQREKAAAVSLAAKEAKRTYGRKIRHAFLSLLYFSGSAFSAVGLGLLSSCSLNYNLRSPCNYFIAFSIPAVASSVVLFSAPYIAKKAYRTVFGSDKYNPEKIFKPRIGPGYTRIKIIDRK